LPFIPYTPLNPPAGGGTYTPPAESGAAAGLTGVSLKPLSGEALAEMLSAVRPSDGNT